MKAVRITIKTVPALNEPVLGVPAKALNVHTQAKLDALRARYKTFGTPKALPVEYKKALAMSS